MEETKSVIKGEFDRSGQYDSGLKSLVKSLQWAFAFLLVVIIGLMVYFVTAGGYFSVEPQNAVIVMQFGKIEFSEQGMYMVSVREPEEGREDGIRYDDRTLYVLYVLSTIS